MYKRLAPAAIPALKEALCDVYWYKAEMSYMLHNNPIATFKWDWPDVKVVVE